MSDSSNSSLSPNVIEQGDQKALVEAIIATAVDAIITIDQQGTMLSFNHSAEKMLGYSAHEAIGSNVSMLMPEPERSQHDQYIKKYLETGHGKIIGVGREVNCLRKNREVFPAQLSVSEVQGFGQPIFTGILSDLSKIKKAQQHNESLATFLEESVNEICVFDTETLLFKLVNRKARENLGYSQEEFLQLTPLDLKKDLSKQEFLDLLNPLIKGSSSAVGLTARHYRKDGSSYPIEVQLMLSVLDGRPVIFAIILDISEKEHFKEMIRWREEEHRLMLDHAPLGVATLDMEGHILFFNRSAEVMSGYRTEDLLGKKAVTLLQGRDIQQAQESFTRLVEGKDSIAIFSQRILRPDKQERTVQVHCAAIKDKTKKVVNIVVMFSDVTAQLATEKALSEQRERLAHAARVGALGQMSAGIAHEINQPLSAIATYAEASKRLVAQNSVNKKDLAQALSSISDQALRAGRVVKRMRSLVKGSSGQRQSVAINELVMDIEPLIKIDSDTFDVHVHCDLTVNLPSIRVDDIQIQQVLLNFIRNGMDAMKENDEATRNLTIKTAYDGHGSIMVRVSDQGSGISEEQELSLFHPFYTTKAHGMGMGLSIAKAIIDAHGGKIGYQANVPRGSTFWFMIPVANNE